MVNNLGRTAAETLVVNYRARMNCYDSRQVSRRMRQALVDFRDAVGLDDAGQKSEWHPPQRGRGMPDAGVVTLGKQPNEEHAFGPAAPLVNDRQGCLDGTKGLEAQVDRAQARVRRRKSEEELLRKFCVTLPPETLPLDDE